MNQEINISKKYLIVELVSANFCYLYLLKYGIRDWWISGYGQSFVITKFYMLPPNNILTYKYFKIQNGYFTENG